VAAVDGELLEVHLQLEQVALEAKR
jgi:hypothetical protein